MSPELQIARLKRVNESLRTGFERMAEAKNLDDILDVLILEAIRATSASGGAVLRHTGSGTEFEFVALAQGETLTRDALASTFVDSIKEYSAKDTTGFFGRILEGEIICLTTEEIGGFYPVAAEYHRNLGNVITWNIPFRIGDRVAGYLGLAYKFICEPDQVTRETLKTLASQACMAVQLRQMSEEARQMAIVRERERSTAAIALEREQAAHERAAALAKANQILGASLDNLLTLTDQREFLRQVFGECARLSEARGGALFFHEPRTDFLHKELGWIKDEVVDFSTDLGSDNWHDPIPAEKIPNWSEAVQIDSKDQQIWVKARPWHRGQGYGWLYRVPLKAGTKAFGFMGLAFTRREDVTAEKSELLCSMAHQISLAVQLDRLAHEAKHAAVLEERNRIARDLHDVLAQGFVGVLTQIGVLEGAMEIGDSREIVRSMDRARAIAREGLEEARRSVYALRPTVQRDQSLFDRLKAMVVGTTEGTTLRALTSQTGEAFALGENLDWTVVKFVQQALTNTMRYARAEQFNLQLEWTPSDVQITASDNGIGFDLQAPRRGIGLRVMRERAEECGGTLDIQSVLGQGTALHLKLPVQYQS